MRCERLGNIVLIKSTPIDSGQLCIDRSLFKFGHLWSVRDLKRWRGWA
uniref:Putative disease resistance RPP13-like protein 1 n=1 Tax=Rhizophora mucronata TaxID=61149 RepID=A0A2P2L987_RHIMU